MPGLEEPHDESPHRRLPRANRLQEVARRAAEDDLVVASGFFTVSLRRGKVLLAH